MINLPAFVLDAPTSTEIAIKDVSLQIQLQAEQEENGDVPSSPPVNTRHLATAASSSSDFGAKARRFNPRVDPTVLFLEMKNLKLHLDNFYFRIEKKENRTIFDPVFEGRGMVSLQNVSIRLRIECAKERRKPHGESPILHLSELEVSLEKVRLKVRDTGFGSDWLLNRAVQVFTENITQVVQDNLKEQFEQQVKMAIMSINSYFAMNPNILLSILGISMDDLDTENVVWV